MKATKREYNNNKMQTIWGFIANSPPSCCAAADFGLVWLPKRQQGAEKEKGTVQRESAAKPTPAAKEHDGITALEQSWNNNTSCSLMPLSLPSLALPVLCLFGNGRAATATATATEAATANGV